MRLFRAPDKVSLRTQTPSPLEALGIKIQAITSHKMTDSDKTSESRSKETENIQKTDDIGYMIFSAIKRLRSVAEKIPGSDTEQDSSTSSQQDTPTKIQENLSKHSNPMEQVMPLDKWKSLTMHEREQFLDQFYNIRDRYRLEREADEQCASDTLALFKCKKSFEFSFNVWRWTDRSLSFQEKVDPCLKFSESEKRCRTMMKVISQVKLLLYILMILDW